MILVFRLNLVVLKYLDILIMKSVKDEYTVGQEDHFWLYSVFVPIPYTLETHLEDILESDPDCIHQNILVLFFDL